MKMAAVHVCVFFGGAMVAILWCSCRQAWRSNVSASLPELCCLLCVLSNGSGMASNVRAAFSYRLCSYLILHLSFLTSPMALPSSSMPCRQGKSVRGRKVGTRDTTANHKKRNTRVRKGAAKTFQRLQAG